jgi:tetratricopeptide (TPR) repeat protein
MINDDEKLESMLADPWLAKPRTRWSLSIVFVTLALLALKPVIVDRLVSRAEAYTSYNMYNNVERECQKAIWLEGGNIRAWNLLGNAYKSRGDMTNAVSIYLNAININPANKVAHFKVAMIFTLDKEYNRAIPHFELLRLLGPETQSDLARDSFSYYQASLEMLSLCYEKAGRTDKVNDIIKDLAQTHSSSIEDEDMLQVRDAK